MPPVRRLPAGHLLRCLSCLLRELIIEIGVWFITRAVKSLKTQINKGGCSVGCRSGQGPPKPAEALRSGVGGNTRSQHTARCRVVAVVRQLLSLPFRKVCVVRPSAPAASRDARHPASLFSRHSVESRSACFKNESTTPKIWRPAIPTRLLLPSDGVSISYPPSSSLDSFRQVH